MIRNDIQYKIGNAPLAEVAVQAMSIINKMQDKPGNTGVQVLAAASVFVLLCERFGIDEKELFSLTQRSIRHSDVYIGKQQLDVVRSYLKEELR